MRSVYEIIEEEEKTKRKRKQKQKEAVENKNKSNKLLVFKKYTHKKRNKKSKKNDCVIIYIYVYFGITFLVPFVVFSRVFVAFDLVSLIVCSRYRYRCRLIDSRLELCSRSTLSDTFVSRRASVRNLHKMYT